MTADANQKPVALTIAGSDSSGGAGIQADLKTFTALCVYGASAITAITAQNTTGVRRVHTVPRDMVSAQIAAVCEDLPVAAVKTGMLANAETVRVVADELERHKHGPVVVDPVMIATSGDALCEPDTVAEICARLIPLARVITPNLAEAAALLRTRVAKSDEEAGDQARMLLKLGAGAVLLKGGHGAGLDATDWLAEGGRVIRYRLPRLETKNTHGTGCTLAAAIAARLARGVDLGVAVQQAKTYVWEAMAAARGNTIGAGQGPLDHSHAIALKYSSQG